MIPLAEANASTTVSQLVLRITMSSPGALFIDEFSPAGRDGECHVGARNAD